MQHHEVFLLSILYEVNSGKLFLGLTQAVCELLTSFVDSKTKICQRLILVK